MLWKLVISLKSRFKHTLPKPFNEWFCVRHVKYRIRAIIRVMQGKDHMACRYLPHYPRSSGRRRGLGLCSVNHIQSNS